MIIRCATTNAAAEVLLVLSQAQIRPGSQFRMTPDPATKPPIAFTILVELPAGMLYQLRRIPNTTVSRK